jgi:hypothetical protein
MNLGARIVEEDLGSLFGRGWLGSSELADH